MQQLPLTSCAPNPIPHPNQVKSGGFCFCRSVWHVEAKRDEVLRRFAELGEVLKAAAEAKPKSSAEIHAEAKAQARAAAEAKERGVQRAVKAAGEVGTEAKAEAKAAAKAAKEGAAEAKAVAKAAAAEGRAERVKLRTGAAFFFPDGTPKPKEYAKPEAKVKPEAEEPPPGWVHCSTGGFVRARGAEAEEGSSPELAKGAKKPGPIAAAIRSMDMQPGWAVPRKPTSSEREAYNLPPEKPLAAQATRILKRYDTNCDGDT